MVVYVFQKLIEEQEQRVKSLIATLPDSPNLDAIIARLGEIDKAEERLEELKRNYNRLGEK